MGKVVNLVQQLSYAVRQLWSMMTENKRNEEVEQLETSKGNDLPPPQPTKSPSKEGWQLNMTAEFPWYLEGTVHEESNWRGTWILEVKDIEAVDWDNVKVPPNGSGVTVDGRYQQRRPTKSSSTPLKEG